MISSRLSALGIPLDLDGTLHKKRNAELQKAIRLARSLKKMAPVELDDITGDKLSARIDKVMSKLANRVEKPLPVVLSNVTKKKSFTS